MGKVISLNKYRKQKAKAEASKRADTNRRFHGRTAAERAREKLQNRQIDAKLDGARLDTAPEDPEDGT